MSSPHSLHTPPPPRPPARPSSGFAVLWSEFLRHGKRWLQCDFTRMSATPEERSALAAASPPIAEPVVQDYVAWRRSMVWVALPLAAIATIHAFVEFVTTKTGPESIDPNTGIGTGGFASFLALLIFASRGALLVALFLSARAWTGARKDRLRLRWAWAIALFVPVVLMLLPLRDLLMLETSEFRRALEQNPAIANLYGGTIGMVMAIGVFLSAVPGLTSVFPGLIRAGMILKTLLPGRSLGPTVSVLLTPVYALVMLVLLAVLQQIGNGPLFLMGAILLLAAPVASLKSAWGLVPPMSRTEAGTRLTRYRSLGRWLTAAGLVLLLIGFFTAKFFGQRMLAFGDGLVKVHDALLLVVWFFAMLTVYTVVSADGLLQAMRLADARRDYAQGSPEFRRDTTTLVQVEQALVAPPSIVVPPAPTSP